MKPALFTLAIVFSAFSQIYGQFDNHFRHHGKPKPRTVMQLRTEGGKVSLDSAVNAKHTKDAYYYDANGNDTLDVYSIWDSKRGKWKPVSKYVWAYDANGYFILDASYIWDSIANQWNGDHKWTYVKDAKDNDTLYIGYVWNKKASQWRQSLKMQTTFDAKGKNTLSISSKWDTTSNQWVKTEKREYTYDTNENETLYNDYTWDSNAKQWVNTGRNVTVYDAYGNKTSNSQYSWNGTSLNLSVEYYYDNALGANNKPTAIIQSSKYGSGSTTSINLKTEYAYDVNGKIISSIIYSWNPVSSQWVTLQKNENVYNINGKNILESHYVWNPKKNRWEGQKRYEHWYDVNENLTLFAEYNTLDTTSGQWVGTYGYKYGYDLSVLSSSLGTPYIAVDEEFSFNNKLTYLSDIYWANGGWNLIYPYTLYYSDGPTGITLSQVQNTSIKLYPNPCKDLLNIQTDGESISGYEILSQYGSVLKSYKGAAQTIEMNHLPSGAYFLKLSSSTHSKVYKIIKE